MLPQMALLAGLPVLPDSSSVICTENPNLVFLDTFADEKKLFSDIDFNWKSLDCQHSIIFKTKSFNRLGTRITIKCRENFEVNVAKQ